MYEKVKLFVEYGVDINTEFLRITGYWEQLSENEKEEIDSLFMEMRN